MGLAGLNESGMEVTGDGVGWEKRSEIRPKICSSSLSRGDPPVTLGGGGEIASSRAGLGCQ